MRRAKQKEMFEIKISDLKRREILHLRSVCPGGEFQYFWVFSGKSIFLGYEDFVDIYFFLFFFWGGGGGGVAKIQISI